MLSLAAFATALSLPMAVSAQGEAVLRGLVRTARTGVPVQGIGVVPMAWGDTSGRSLPAFVHTDSAGMFVLRSNYSRTLRLSFTCPKESTPFRLIAIRMARFTLGQESRMTLEIPEEYCASQPHIELKRLFSGWYIAEFEGSSFQACPDEPVPRTLRYRASAMDTLGFWGTPTWLIWHQRRRKSCVAASRRHMTALGTDGL
jgi:hypothetical protein